MRFALALVLALSFVGCRGTAPLPEAPADGPYAGVPSRPAEGPIAMAQPVIPTGDDRLDDFLGELAAAIDRQDWLGVAQRMDPEVFPEQRALLERNGSAETAAPQLLLETLGIRSLTEAGPTWDDLGRIRVVTFRQHTVQTPGIAGGDSFDLIDGTVRLDDGSTLPLSFTIASRGGAHVVVVPVG
ncbi:MAG: hypothetical protein AAF791_11205 [Bacteroidota bacterium]